ncbi:MAG TPA: GH116 family glycosyl hydrolase, partial [Chloroflexota bacterium]
MREISGSDSGDIRARPRVEAERVLLANGGELGLLGANAAYQQVWARDSMICGLGLILCGPEGRAIHRRSMETLRRHQTPLGNVAHNVGLPGVADPALIAHGGMLERRTEDGAEVTDTIHAGCVDSALWYIVAHYYDYVMTGDTDFLETAWDSLEKALLWLRYQDSNECGLLEVHEAMDWADLFVNRYNVLYDNVLYYAAWKAMAGLARALGRAPDFYDRNARDVHRKINAVLWVGPEEVRDWEWVADTRREWLYTLRRIDTELVERPFYLP